ncbi:hypothetical protein FRB95_010789 [Tulasnella sp. JGI-2019a]|nr:hypothetical protein FRB95_010789 [Tulasnella sp. JGI-2019a]
MHHAELSFIPSTVTTKSEFWAHVYSQLESLIEGQRGWVSNLSNASALVYHALRSFPPFGVGERAVNWCGFYLEASIFPLANSATATSTPTLYVGPFNGKPACQYIRCIQGKGVCADAFLKRETLVVPNVDEYPGHIACDGETKSELVIPMVQQADGIHRTLGVMDLDCLLSNAFDDEDRIGLEKIAKLLVDGCDW